MFNWFKKKKPMQVIYLNKNLQSNLRNLKFRYYVIGFPNIRFHFENVNTGKKECIAFKYNDIARSLDFYGYTAFEWWLLGRLAYEKNVILTNHEDLTTCNIKDEINAIMSEHNKNFFKRKFTYGGDIL